MNHHGLSSLAYASSIIICGMTFNSHAAIIINEIDYDQSGVDKAEFIELFNSGNSTISLDGYRVDLINGTKKTNNPIIYRHIDLSGFNINANDYLVICGDAARVVNCNYSFTTTGNWFQNGDNDAIALYKDTNLLDSMSYEGALSPFTEGDAPAAKDDSTKFVSLARITNGFDSNNNNLDFQRGCTTPGSANIAETGNCLAPQVNAVPLPAAAWLFGSGMIGLMGFARRKE